MPVCRDCHGTGQREIKTEITTRCPDCDGTGVKDNLHIKVSKLPLTEDGDIISIKFRNDAPLNVKVEIISLLRKSGHRGSVVFIGWEDDIDIEVLNAKDFKKSKNRQNKK